MTLLSEGKRRNHGPCISLRALVFGALIVAPIWTAFVLAVIR